MANLRSNAQFFMSQVRNGGGVNVATPPVPKGTLSSGLSKILPAFMAMCGGNFDVSDEGNALTVLYRDLVKNWSEFWSSFLPLRENSVHCERVCGCIGTLATLKRQRGEFDELEEIFKVYTKVLNFYRDSVEGTENAQERECCDGLTYKHHIVKWNTMLETTTSADEAAYSKMLELFKFAGPFELKFNKPDEYSILFGAPSQLMDVEYIQTLEAHDRCFVVLVETSRVNAAIMRRMNQYPHGSTTNYKKSEDNLKTCSAADCEKKETARGEFKTCSRCQKVFYCSADCQKNAWGGGHKKFCKLSCSDKEKEKPTSGKNNSKKRGGGSRPFIRRNGKLKLIVIVIGVSWFK